MITSTANDRIKSIRKLQERKYRAESGLFYVEGLKIVGEAVEMGAQVEELVVAPELLSSEFGRELAQAQARRGVPLLEVSAGVFQKLALKENRRDWLPWCARTGCRWSG